MNYQNIIRNIDTTLAKMLVSGDNVMYLAYARQCLGELAAAIDAQPAVGRPQQEEAEE